MTGIDVHQHLWPSRLVEQLRRRNEPPWLDRWTLHLPGSAPLHVDPGDHDVQAREQLDPDLALVVVALSAGLGIEYLDPTDATPLLDAWHEGVAELPDRFAAWGSARLVEPDAAEVGALLKGPFVGLELPATALATPAAVEALAPLLQAVEQADKPVLVHPGLAARPPGWPGGTGGTAHATTDVPLPLWWTPVVDYVGQLQAAWWAWAVAGRAVAPRLRICFAAGAGLAPVHHERLTARGGHLDGIDPLTFVDGSSYGPQALDAVIRVLGIDTVVLGSDRPYASARLPGLGPAADHAIRVTNPTRLLTGATSRRPGGTARSSERSSP
jgi:hypothetical protein